MRSSTENIHHFRHWTFRALASRSWPMSWRTGILALRFWRTSHQRILKIKNCDKISELNFQQKVLYKYKLLKFSSSDSSDFSVKCPISYWCIVFMHIASHSTKLKSDNYYAFPLLLLTLLSRRHESILPLMDNNKLTRTTSSYKILWCTNSLCLFIFSHSGALVICWEQNDINRFPHQRS